LFVSSTQNAISDSLPNLVVEVDVDADVDADAVEGGRVDVASSAGGSVATGGTGGTGGAAAPHAVSPSKTIQRIRQW